MAEQALLGDSLPEFQPTKENVMATVAKPETSQAALTKQLDKILNDLRDVIKKRNEKIAALREEIEQLESENTALDGKINAILSDI